MYSLLSRLKIEFITKFVESYEALVRPTTLGQDTSIDTEVDGEEDKENEDKDGGDTDDDDFNIS